MKLFKELTELENKELLKVPAFVSLLAANSDNKLDAAEKQSAIKFSHIKTYSCNPLLTEFYKAADIYFEKNIQQLDKDLPEGRAAKEAALMKILLSLKKLVEKLGEEYINVFHQSMKSFAEHVSQANHNVLIDFIFPMPIKGLTY